MANEKITLVFLGTPEFSVPTLQALLDAPDEIEILGVVTQPDRPSGRGQKLMPPPVKELALKHNLPVYQPTRIRKDQEVLDWLKELQPQFLVTVAFGQILSQEVLDIPTYGTVNVHASLLPELRGANPIQGSILSGHTQTGLTTMLTDIGVDTGAILLQEATPIDPNETAETLSQRMSAMGGPLLLRTLAGLKSGDVLPLTQDESRATHAPKVKKEDGQIDWGLDAQSLHDKIRGHQPWPGAFTHLDGERIKLLQTLRIPDSEDFMNSAPPGTILGIMKEGLRVQTGNGSLVISQLQPPGKKPMAARDWANGVLKKDPDKAYKFITITEVSGQETAPAKG